MHLSRNIIRVLLTGFLALAAHQAAAQWVQQQIVLKPGWNSVFLEVDPTPGDCDALFAGMPIESVWDWNRPPESAQFVQDPGTLIPGTAGWLTWFPPGHSMAGQGSLFALRDGRPYLIKSTNAQSITWTVTGKPSMRRLAWRAGTVNLAGFHVGAQAPTFRSLFSGHAGLSNQPIYALDVSGVWRAVPDLTTGRPKSGEAYWVRCLLPSQATGTILVEGTSRDGLTFLPTATEQSIRIRNASIGPRHVTIRVLPSATPPNGETPSAGPVPLEYWRASYATTNLDWVPLSAPLSFASLPEGKEWNLRLAVPGSVLSASPPGSMMQSLLEVTDDLGTRWLVPIKAGKSGAVSSGSEFQAAAETEAPALAGLWVGDAVINAVSQPARTDNPALPRPAGGNFTFRIIMHVDTAGTARLLQQIYLVRKPPVLVPSEEDPTLNEVAEPARTVAVTDESLIPGVIGTGTLMGQRISSPVFAFNQPLALSGGAFGTGTLQGSCTLPYDHPLNPFRHAFHPDHNNLDERFEQKLPEGKESFSVARAVSFEFTANDPLGLNPPGWGATEIGGIYRESITGLHRSVIHASGSFRLVRVLSTPTLNQ
jgi:hypothetical protein